MALGAYAHADVPFEKLVEELAPQRDLSRNPLFQVTFQLFESPTAPDAVGVEAGLEVPVTTSLFDLRVDVWPAGGGLAGRVEFDTDLFDRVSVEWLLERFGLVLEQLADDPEQRLGELWLLPPAQRQLLERFNDTAAELPQGCVQDLVSAWAARTPDAVAVTDRDGSFSYGQLEGHAEGLARRLGELGLERGALVAICLERGRLFTAAALAALKAGCAYLPLDPAYPPARLERILNDAAAPLLLTSPQLAARLTPPPATATLLLDPWPHSAAGPPGRAAGPDEAAYVIYTSGSTGTPKGVVCKHRALINLVAWHQHAYTISPPRPRRPDRQRRLRRRRLGDVALPHRRRLRPRLRRRHPRRRRRADRWLDQHQITVAFIPTPLAELLLARPWPAQAPCATSSPAATPSAAGPTPTTPTHSSTTTAPPNQPSSPPPPPSPQPPPPANSPPSAHPSTTPPATSSTTTDPRPTRHPRRTLDRRHKPRPRLPQRPPPHHQPLHPKPLPPPPPPPLPNRRPRPPQPRPHPHLPRPQRPPNQNPRLPHRTPRNRNPPPPTPPHHPRRRHHPPHPHPPPHRPHHRLCHGATRPRRPAPSGPPLADAVRPDLCGACPTGSSAEFDIRGWNSSYDGDAPRREAMREQVEQTVGARGRAAEPRRILEIGCGTGLLLFRLAAGCERYCADRLLGRRALGGPPRAAGPAGVAARRAARVRGARARRGSTAGSSTSSCSTRSSSTSPTRPTSSRCSRPRSTACGRAAASSSATSATSPCWSRSTRRSSWRRHRTTCPRTELRRRVRRRIEAEQELLLDPAWFARFAERQGHVADGGCVAPPAGTRGKTS